MAGLNGAACVSEYSPGQELLFNENEVPTFFLVCRQFTNVTSIQKVPKLYYLQVQSFSLLHSNFHEINNFHFNQTNQSALKSL